MSKYLFKCQCPICQEGDIFQWNHSNCGRRFIDEDLYLICEKCNDRTFVLEASFACGKNNHTKPEKPDVYCMISTLGRIGNIPDLNGPTRKKMIDKLKKYIDNK